MDDYSIDDATFSGDRYKMYIFQCANNKLPEAISFLSSNKINTVNVGKRIAQFINSLPDHSYLPIDTYEHTKQLLEENKFKRGNSGNAILAIYNLGILFEPSLEMNVTKLLKDFSKSASLIIIWENHVDQSGKLNWPTQTNHYSLNFSEIQLKRLQHAI